MTSLNKKFHAEIDAKTKQYQKIYDFEILNEIFLEIYKL